MGAGLVILATLTSAGVAQAAGEFKYWNSSSSPLTVSGYGSTAYAYGGWRIYSGTNGTRAYTDANRRINNAANHQAYVTSQTWVNAGYCLASTYLSCNAAYYYYKTATSARTNSSSWQWHYGFSTDLPGAANYARAGIRTHLDIPWRTDPSSGAVWTNGSAY